MTLEAFSEIAFRAGLSILEQFDSWGDESEFVLSNHGDMISVIRKPQIQV